MRALQFVLLGYWLGRLMEGATALRVSGLVMALCGLALYHAADRAERRRGAP